MHSGSHLQRNFGCSDTALASCLHPHAELSNILDSLFRTSSLRAPILILPSSIFVCITSEKKKRWGGDTKLKLCAAEICPWKTPCYRLRLWLTLMVCEKLNVEWISHLFGCCDTKLQVVNISSGFPVVKSNVNVWRGEENQTVTVHTHRETHTHIHTLRRILNLSNNRKWNDVDK